MLKQKSSLTFGAHYFFFFLCLLNYVVKNMKFDQNWNKKNVVIRSSVSLEKLIEYHKCSMKNYKSKFLHTSHIIIHSLWYLKLK